MLDRMIKKPFFVLKDKKQFLKIYNIVSLFLSISSFLKYSE